MDKKRCATLAALIFIAPVAHLYAEAPVGDSGAAADGKDRRPPLAKLLKSADANSDQKLDLAEIHTKLPKFPAERFATLDKNQDGFLEAGELPERPKMEAGAGGGGAVGAKLRAADTDQDGKLSSAEFTAGFPNAPAERFAALDRNSDGFVDKSDREGLEAAAGDKKQDRAEGGGKGEAGGAGRGEMGQKLRAADTDQDGKLSQAEFTAGFPNAPAERFAALDRNSDGYVDKGDREGLEAAAGKQKRGKADGGKKTSAGSLAEAVQYVKGLIAAHDADKDGKLTKAELETAKPGFPEKSFTDIDRDQDGVISAADFPTSTS